MGMELIERSFPLVLKNILGKLDTPDLQTGRLVNRTWNREACQILKKWKWISFQKLDQIRPYCGIFEGVDPDLSLVLEHISFEASLFSQVLEKAEEGGLQELYEVLNRLAKVVGQSIIELHVSFDRIENPSGIQGLYRELHEMIYEKFPNVRELSVYLGSVLFLPEGSFQGDLPRRDLPNLVTLSVDLFSYEEDLPKCVEGAKEFVQNLIKSAINLRTLHSLALCGGNPVLVDDIIANFPKVASSLEKLYLGPPMTDEGAEALTSRGFPNLTQLNMYISPSQADPKQWCRVSFQWGMCPTRPMEVGATDPKSLEKVLQKYSGTLKELRLMFDQLEAVMWLREVPPPGVVLRVLEELSISHYCGEAVCCQAMPKLRRLSLLRSSNISRILSTFPNTKVESDKCFLTHCEITGSLGRIGGSRREDEFLFPVGDPAWLGRLTKLHIQDLMLPKRTLATIASHCHQLEEFTLRGCRGVDDEALTGIRASLLQSISPVRNLQGMEEDEEEVVEIMITMARAVPKRNPCIGNLINLRTVALMENSEISDDAILFGIVECEKLKKLRFSRCKNLTWRAEQIIRQMIEMRMRKLD